MSWSIDINSLNLFPGCFWFLQARHRPIASMWRCEEDYNGTRVARKDDVRCVLFGWRKASQLLNQASQPMGFLRSWNPCILGVNWWGPAKPSPCPAMSSNQPQMPSKSRGATFLPFLDHIHGFPGNLKNSSVVSMYPLGAMTTRMPWGTLKRTCFLHLKPPI